VKILVAGGAGYIGSACAEYLLDRDNSVTILDSLVTGHEDAVDKRAAFVKGDLGDRDFVFSAMRKGKFDAVMHFAAFSLVGESMRDPGKYFRNNIGCGLNLVDAAVETGVKTIVFSSTAATYGMPEEMPITEKTPQNPINPYGESKLCFEKILRWNHEIHGIKYAALRYFNASGATSEHGEDHRPETHLIPLVIQAAMGKRDKITVFGNDYDTPDGTCVRDYIHITDLAQAHALALTAPRSGHYNLGTGSGLSVREIINASREVTGKTIKEESAPRRPGDPPRLIACSDLARKELGWKPRFEDAKVIIESVYKWALKHPDGYAR
jgi:UDP-glucose 4-epimerase